MSKSFFSRPWRRLRARKPRAESFRPTLETLDQRIVPALMVTDMVSPEALVQEILGSGISVSNIQFQGKSTNIASAGTFMGGTGIIGFECGIILGSGTINHVIGPNSSNSISADLGLPGDPTLDVLVAPRTTQDATVLSFDFIPSSSTLTFQYVFSSDEYPEFVGTAFNDVFGFFLNGVNVALIPGTNTPVTINNVNQDLNSQYFRNNALPNATIDTEMDGLTTVLTVTATVTPGVTNHIKLAIADTSDGIYDSFVFIKANSFTSGDDLANKLIVAGADAGAGPHVRVYDPQTLDELYSFFAYDPEFLGGVRVAVGDVNGDGFPDIVTGSGPGSSGHVRVFDGKTGQILPGAIGNFLAFDLGFQSGIFVAVGDVNNDGFADVGVSADMGGGPHVKVFSGRDGSLMQSFFAYDQSMTGGVRIAMGDVNHDHHADIITGTGPGFAPRVKVFSGANPGQVLDGAIGDFLAFNASFLNGIWVSTGNFSGIDCPTASVIVGAGSVSTPHVKVFDEDGNLTASFFAGPVGGNIYGSPFRTGIRPAALDLNGDGIDDILASFGAGRAPEVRAFELTSNPLGDKRFMVFDTLFLGGVFIAAG